MLWHMCANSKYNGLQCGQLIAYGLLIKTDESILTIKLNHFSLPKTCTAVAFQTLLFILFLTFVSLTI